MRPLDFQNLPRVISGQRRIVWSVLAAIVTAASVVITPHESVALTVAAVVLALSALAGAWRFPWPALACAVAAYGLLPSDQAMMLAVLTVLYVIAGRETRTTTVLAAAGSAAVMTLSGEVHGGSTVAQHGGPLGYAFSNSSACAAAVALGLYIISRRRVLDGLRERAGRLERERELLTERALAEERVRIAQELHDIVAHNVSLMVVQAQALGATADTPAVAQTTEAIADLGRQAMAQMHITLRLLRIGSGDQSLPEHAPQPGLGQLEELIEGSRTAGLPIELTISGRPRTLTQDVDLSAFRIVQEALTNVVKHAAGAPTKVAVVYHPDAVTLAVRDVNHDPRPQPDHDTNGHGLLGMRERAAMLGGELTAERLNDGFQVTATLPYSSAVTG